MLVSMLPDELLQCVVHMLAVDNVRSFIAVLCVCKHWKNTIDGIQELRPLLKPFKLMQNICGSSLDELDVGRLYKLYCAYAPLEEAQNLTWSDCQRDKVGTFIFSYKHIFYCNGTCGNICNTPALDTFMFTIEIVYKHKRYSAISRCSLLEFEVDENNKGLWTGQLHNNVLEFVLKCFNDPDATLDELELRVYVSRSECPEEVVWLYDCEYDTADWDHESDKLEDAWYSFKSKNKSDASLHILSFFLNHNSNHKTTIDPDGHTTSLTVPVPAGLEAIVL